MKTVFDEEELKEIKKQEEDDRQFIQILFNCFFLIWKRQFFSKIVVIEILFLSDQCDSLRLAQLALVKPWSSLVEGDEQQYRPKW